MTKSIALAFTLSLLLGANTFAYAKGESSTPTNQAEESTSPIMQTEDVRKGINPNDEPDIKAQVQVFVVSLENLRESGMAIEKVRRASTDLYEEVSRREVTLTSTPNVIGFTVMNMPSGFTTGNYLPPRKKWVNAYMQEMITVIKLMKEENDDVINGKTQLLVPESTREPLKVLFDQWVELVGDTCNKLSELEKITAQPAFNNAAIANDALAIHKDMKQLEGLRKKVYKILQKAGKDKEETASLHDGVQ